MRRTAVLLLAIMVCIAFPAFAQETKDAAKAAAAMPAPPKPLEDDFTKWMLGEWEGTSTSPMGTSQDWQKVEMGLDNQFVVTHYTSKMGEMTYKGMGPMTMNPETGEFVSYWFDNFRGMYKGTGKREGNKVTMTFTGPMGTETRTMEKVSDDKFVVVFKSQYPDGNVMEGRTEMTRKKMATTK